MTHGDSSTPPATERKASMPGRTILAIVVLIMLVGMFYLGRTTGTATALTDTAVSTSAPAATPKPTIIAGAGILRRIQALSRLETAMYNIETVVRSEQEGQQVLFLKIPGQQLLQVVEGRVIAGIDLDKLKASDISVSSDNKTVTVQLPPAEIFIASLDKSQIEDYKGILFTSPDPALLAAAEQAGREKIQEIACRDKILEMATKQGQASITNLLSAFSLDNVSFIVLAALVPSCTMNVTVKPTVTP